MWSVEAEVTSKPNSVKRLRSQSISWPAETAAMNSASVVDLGGSGPCLAGTIDEMVAHHY